MTMTIEKRIRRMVLAAILTTFAVMAVAVLVANERLERILLRMDARQERAFLLADMPSGQAVAWDTPWLKAYYIPAGMVADERLPAIFHGIESPFSGEVELDGTTFLMTVGPAQGGRFYLAKDISHFERNEANFHRFLLLLGVALVALGVLLARITSRRLAGPVQQLTRQISQITPAQRMQRVREDYDEAELRAIARSFNAFLGELETYVKREQSLMGLASHELRTPIAVIAGALDVLEQRGGAGGMALAQGPLGRIRRATDEMAANIDLILKLTRRKSAAERLADISLSALLEEIRDDLARQTPGAHRIELEVRQQARVHADPALVKMLLRNLVQNALQHTSGAVRVDIAAHAVEIRDGGPGLPAAYLAYLNDPAADAGELLSLSGLGLFIVTLICERLGWTLQAASGSAGTTTRILFTPAAES